MPVPFDTPVGKRSHERKHLADEDNHYWRHTSHLRASAVSSFLSRDHLVVRNSTSNELQHLASPRSRRLLLPGNPNQSLPSIGNAPNYIGGSTGLLAGENAAIFPHSTNFYSSRVSSALTARGSKIRPSATALWRKEQNPTYSNTRLTVPPKLVSLHRCQVQMFCRSHQMVTTVPRETQLEKSWSRSFWRFQSAGSGRYLVRECNRRL